MTASDNPGGQLVHVVLDHNFPIQSTGLPWPRSIRVSPLRDVAPSLIQAREDWQVLLGLEELGGVDGFITNDGNMLKLPKEMVALSRTRLALIVAEGVGHDPVRATGLVMVYLQQVARTVDGKPKVYMLQPGVVRPYPAFDAVKRVAKHTQRPLDRMIQEELSDMGLTRRHGGHDAPARQ